MEVCKQPAELVPQAERAWAWFEEMGAPKYWVSCSCTCKRRRRRRCCHQAAACCSLPFSLLDPHNCCHT